MRNTNNGQTSDFVRAVTRNRDTTWRGLIAIARSNKTAVAKFSRGALRATYGARAIRQFWLRHWPTAHVL